MMEAIVKIKAVTEPAIYVDDLQAAETNYWKGVLVVYAFLKAREVQPPPDRSRSKREPEGGPLEPALGEALLKKGQAVKVGKEYDRVWNEMILFY
jgi:hypothetical protein